MGVAINDKHRVCVHERKNRSQERSRKKKEGRNVLGSFPARCMIKERQRMLCNRLFLAEKINDETMWVMVFCRYRGKINEREREREKRDRRFVTYSRSLDNFLRE